MNISDFYIKVLNFTPYNYQVKVSELLLSGKNVILSVPTGAGKTWASILPYLFARENNYDIFPHKLIYSLPLRTLTNSIYTDVNEILEKSNFSGLTSIHTGEYKNDDHFESDILFSTIDQTLSSFLSFPLSLSKRQANINAGAFVGSYLVFDEFHLLEPKLSMSTTLGTLKTLKNLSRFCIMTATLSESYISELKEVLNAEVVSINDFPEDALKIGSLKIPDGRRVKKSIHITSTIINGNAILKAHKNKTIVICNRVEKAQQLYDEIAGKDLPGLNKSNILCLHSRFFDDDRKDKEKRLKELFGKNNNEGAILISTQVIEAGMDISCDTMHVEISPINSFLQRAGRCARWEGQFGEIYVYDILELEEREKLNIETTTKEESQLNAINNKYLPYSKELCEATLAELKNISFLDKDVSSQLVDLILTKKEHEDYSKMKSGDFNKSKIQESWSSCEKNMYSQTIRDIQSIEVAIIDFEKERDSCFVPYKYQTISLFKWSFIKWAKEILSENEDILFVAEDIKDSQFLDWDTLNKEGFVLKPINDTYYFKNYYDVVFVDKSVFNYTKEKGLELGVGAICSPLKPYDKKEKEIIEYKKDTFYQHNKAIINCYEVEYKPKLNFVFQQLNSYWGEEIDWDTIIKTMICLHDYGKLNKVWQQPMKKLQELKANGNFFENEVLAHCDFNELTDKEIEKQSGAKNKPAHAGIGAHVLAEISEEVFGSEDLGRSVVTAILKHHGVDTESYPDFDIAEYEYTQVDQLLKNIGIDARIKQKARGGKLIDFLPINREEWFIYFFLVRILRLSDQKATINFEKYLNE